MTDFGLEVLSVADLGIRPSASPNRYQGDKIQQAIDTLLDPGSPYHTLLFPTGPWFSGTFPAILTVRSVSLVRR